MDLSFRVISAPGEHDKEILEFFKANDADFYPPIAARRELTSFVQSVYNDDGQYFLCYDNERIVGLSTLIAKHPSFMYYYQYVAVDKDYRHKGIGNHLYDMVTHACNEKGILRAIVKTWSLNTTSQSMFRKHGFFHADTAEDDRNKGVHSYFFFKSFSRHRFQQPLRRLCVYGSGVTMVNFAKMLAAVTKELPYGSGQLPFVIISDPVLENGNIGDLAGFIEEHLPPSASHLMFTDLSVYQDIESDRITGGVEVPDMLAIARDIIDNKDKKWLLLGDNIPKLNTVFDVPNIVLPGPEVHNRICGIIAEIASGLISPSYHKAEFAAMAADSGCQGVLLASPELHGAFGFDRQYNNMEILDPLLELIFIVQNNRIKDQVMEMSSELKSHLNE